MSLEPTYARNTADEVSESVNRLGATLAWKTACFIGPSGVLTIISLFLVNRVAMPLPGGNPILDLSLFLILLGWLAAKLETRVRDWWRSA
jgi:hypothetical protein